MGHAFGRGERVEVCQTPRIVTIVTKDRMSAGELTDATRAFDYVPYLSVHQPGLPKSFVTYHDFDVKYYKGYRVFWFYV